MGSMSAFLKKFVRIQPPCDIEPFPFNDWRYAEHRQWFHAGVGSDTHDKLSSIPRDTMRFSNHMSQNTRRSPAEIEAEQREKIQRWKKEATMVTPIEEDLNNYVSSRVEDIQKDIRNALETKAFHEVQDYMRGNGFYLFDMNLGDKPWRGQYPTKVCDNTEVHTPHNWATVVGTSTGEVSSAQTFYCDGIENPAFEEIDRQVTEGIDKAIAVCASGMMSSDEVYQGIMGSNSKDKCYDFYVPVYSRIIGIADRWYLSQFVKYTTNRRSPGVVAVVTDHDEIHVKAREHNWPHLTKVGNLAQLFFKNLGRGYTTLNSVGTELYLSVVDATSVTPLKS